MMPTGNHLILSDIISATEQLHESLADLSLQEKERDVRAEGHEVQSKLCSSNCTFVLGPVIRVVLFIFIAANRHPCGWRRQYVGVMYDHVYLGVWVRIMQ